MNRSPDHRNDRRNDHRNGRPSDAELETRLRAAGTPPQDRDLAADWALRRELAELGPDHGLPTALRRAVLRHAAVHPRRSTRRWPGLPVALAAGLAGVLVLVAALRPGGPEPSPVSTTNAEQLQLALVTLDRTSRRALALAGRGVREHLDRPEDFLRIELQELPYGHLLDSFRLAPHHPPEPTQES
ncbi:hypothetical protein [Halomonas denitrificans]|nr:hypothetical protein [Halomonas denitrificans]